MTDTWVVENLSSLTLITPGFDDLDLTGDTVDADGNLYSIEALDDDVSWSSPQPVDTAVERWKTDGAIAQTQNQENREITFTVIVSADNPDALAVGEAALALRASKPGILRWTPPQGYPDATSTDFEVWTWHLEHSFNGLDERYTRRVYAVTMTAKPWAKSSALTVEAALPSQASPTITSVDTCASTTGWTGAPNAPTTAGGAVKETVIVSAVLGPHPKPNAHVGAHLIRTVAITGLNVTPYLMLNMSVAGGTAAWSVFADGVSLPKVGQVGSTSYWQMPTGVSSLAALQVSVDVTLNKTATAVVLSVADVSKTDTVGGVGSRKQLTRSLEVGGSVKTSGSIKVASPSGTGLGTVLVYTQPDNGMGYNPGLRQYRTSGNTPSAQSTAVSGFRESLSSVITFTLPANVVPEATYAMVARVYASAAGTATLGGFIGTGSTVVSAALGAKVTWASAGYQWVILGTATFPLLSLPPESAVTSSVGLASVGGTGVALDECYFLDITHGDYSLVNTGSATRLFLNAPDADAAKNRPQVYLGTQDDLSDAVGADGLDQVIVLGDHDLDPNGAVLFTVTDGVDNAAVSASYYQRWHTHAAS